MLLSESLQRLKVADFDLCRYFNKNPLTTGVGREKYMAPEVQKSADKTRHDYPFACDVYSWALCCFYALTGSESEEPQANKLPTVIRQRRVSDTGRTLAHLLSAAINEDPAERPTSAECEETLKSYQENCKGRLLSFFVLKTSFFRFASADLR